jgi:hypothetical protein
MCDSHKGKWEMPNINMAIYHFSARIISRSAGRSATAAAAYRAAERIHDERTGLIFDYRRKNGVAWKQIFAPADAPVWVHDRAQLFNRIEVGENRKDAQVAREIVVALPHELSHERQVDLLSRFARREFVKRGMVADVCLHAKEGNHHAHILLTMRRIGPEGFGAKEVAWNRKELLEEFRESWATHCNRRLRVAGAKSRVDHRSLRAQGQTRRPTIHEGPTLTAMRRKGRTSRTNTINRLITEENNMTREIAGLEMPDELPPENKWREIYNSIEPIPRGPLQDAWLAFDRDYREKIRNAFKEDSALFGRGDNFGPHLRLVLPQGGEVRDYGRRIACETGSDAEAAVSVKLAKAKGWTQLHIQGAEAFRRSVWLEAVRNGFTPEQINGYSPSTDDKNLASDLGLAFTPIPSAEIVHGHDGRKDGASGDGAKTALRPPRRKI